MIELFVAASLHLGLAGNYNNIHPHIKYTTDSNLIVGSYYNSERNPSLYLGKEWKGFEIGAVTGYSAYPVVPFLRYKRKGFFVAPAYETRGNWGIVIGYELKLY